MVFKVGIPDLTKGGGKWSYHIHMYLKIFIFTLIGTVEKLTVHFDLD